MHKIGRSLLLVSLALLVPILPFLAFGRQIDEWTRQWTENPPARPVTAGVVVGLLATDVFLPVPSSMISTMGGWQLGVIGGTAASWTGMSIGAALGFALARRWGRPLALRLTKAEELERMKAMSDRYGPATLVLVRGVPILAEASVLLMGIHHVAWSRFLPPVLLSNLGIALAYSAFGNFAERHQWLPAALGVSVALPVVLAAIVRGWLMRHRPE